MTALGQLAGGIAHDFNNVLQAIQGAVTLLSRNRADPSAVARYAALIDEATSRASSVTRRLLAFARRDTLRAAPIGVQGLLGGMRELLTHTLGTGITVAIDVQSALPDILADRGQLETVLLNLATNARDAMPSGGRLTLSAAVHEVLTEDQPLGLARGEYVRLSVTDTGVGMDATTLTHAMEPFFTTKPQGKVRGWGWRRHAVSRDNQAVRWVSRAPRSGNHGQPVAPRHRRACAECIARRARCPRSPYGPRLARG